jgi:hypothetical protein
MPPTLMETTLNLSVWSSHSYLSAIPTRCRTRDAEVTLLYINKYLASQEIQTFVLSILALVSDRLNLMFPSRRVSLFAR